jgi:hypothetical protein
MKKLERPKSKVLPSAGNAKTFITRLQDFYRIDKIHAISGKDRHRFAIQA